MADVTINRSALERGALAALSGLLSGYTALAVAELLASFVRPQAGPVTAVGGAAIDRTPAPVNDFAIRHFGTDDKLVLQLGIVTPLGLLALLLGLFALHHRRGGAAGVLAFGVLGAVAALSRPDAAGVAALPSLVGAAAGTVVLYVLAGRLTAARPRAGARPAQAPGRFDRRGFLLVAGAPTVVAAGAGALGRVLSGRRGQGAVASRDAVRLPAPASPAAALPARVALRIPGISPFTTPNADFHRVDTALVVPKTDTDTWRLRLHGTGVARPRSYSYQELLGRDLIERDITLTRVSNEVGGPYAGTARRLGVPLADLLREADVRAPSRGGRADQLVARSVDGMTPGGHTLTVRATDGAGPLQTERRTQTIPDGAGGWHSVFVTSG
ncbi:molybdopterin-dependent oxidoreductase [Streptomyces sp. NPDC006529]|uniref:molybdopterin-dependent oxidoreductase n=1 Tax=Streptomyces sp. NPDC006529 TaxID=3157177 RepID=UPI0033B5949F